MLFSYLFASLLISCLILLCKCGQDVHGKIHSMLACAGDTDEDGIDQFKKSNILNIGKDSMEVNLSLDLKWLRRKIVDSDEWFSFFRGIRDLFVSLDSQRHFKRVVVEMLSDIRGKNEQSKLKSFIGGIDEAKSYANKEGRFILLYIEDVHFRQPKKVSCQYRLSLSDPALGAFVNDNFIFYMNSERNKLSRNLLNELECLDPSNFPLFAVLDSNSNSTNTSKAPALLARVRLSHQDITPAKLFRFLERILEVHGSKLHANRKLIQSPQAPSLPEQTDQGDGTSSPSKRHFKGFFPQNPV